MALVIPVRKAIPKLSVGYYARMHIHTRGTHIPARRVLLMAWESWRFVARDRQAQVLISYLSPHLIAIIGCIVTSELAYRSPSVHATRTERTPMYGVS